MGRLTHIQCIRKPTVTPTGKITADNPEERLKKWKDHFHNLLGQPPVVKEQVTTRVIQESLPVQSTFHERGTTDPSLTIKQQDLMMEDGSANRSTTRSA